MERHVVCAPFRKVKDWKTRGEMEPYLIQICHFSIPSLKPEVSQGKGYGSKQNSREIHIVDPSTILMACCY